MTLLNQSTIIYTGNIDATCYTCNLNSVTNQWLCSVANTPDQTLIINIIIGSMIVVIFLLGFLIGSDQV